MNENSSTIVSSNANESIFLLIAKLLNGTDLYKHQSADLMEPEKYSVVGVHAVIWTFTILTYLLAIPIGIRMFHSKAYLNVIDYFSIHIIVCAFIAWIPALILFLHQWFDIFTLRLCRFHYVLLSTNETVPIFFVLYMVIDRFLYVYPSLKYHFQNFTSITYLHLFTLFTWLCTICFYILASPFYPRNSKLTYSSYTTKYCLYDYSKLHLLATVRSIIYFILFIPALFFIGFVLRYFYFLRGTNQIAPIEKLWTIRVTALLCILVFYDIYLFYLEHLAETFRSFLLATLLRSSFYLTQLFIIACTDAFWLEMLIERIAFLCCFLTGQQRKSTVPMETEFRSLPCSSSTGHYSLVDDSIDDEFDRATDEPAPSLRVVT